MKCFHCSHFAHTEGLQRKSPGLLSDPQFPCAPLQRDVLCLVWRKRGLDRVRGVVCVRERLKLEAACLSNTVDPTSCFHCPMFTPQRRRGRRGMALRCQTPRLPKSLRPFMFLYLCRTPQPSIVTEICEEWAMKREAAGDESCSAFLSAAFNSRTASRNQERFLRLCCILILSQTDDIQATYLLSCGWQSCKCSETF